MKILRRLWLMVYLSFSGIVTCKHEARGLYYCPTCEDEKVSRRLVVRKEMDSLR